MSKRLAIDAAIQIVVFTITTKMSVGV